MSSLLTDYQNEIRKEIQFMMQLLSDIEKIFFISKEIIEFLSLSGIKIEKHLNLQIDQLDYRKTN